ncbi:MULTISPECIES: hypothetical protein [Cyanophyceae]|uniref:hypothetical protein n=1 Tax=Cyanophyceae TaxID=3028117 RepID=UPI000A0EF15F|nr:MULTISPECIES: hypothetical protein [Cyanophyceae]SMH35176.1 hypothetical protein SAMN06272755_0646 [Picosynechococcus sp. OG1]
MFYLWDTVFPRDKKPLEKIILKDGESPGNFTLITYKQFADRAEIFLDKMHDLASNRFKYIDLDEDIGEISF